MANSLRDKRINVETFGTSHVDEKVILDLVKKHFELTPGWIISHLELRRPIYRQVASYGHFGRLDLDLPWEKTDKAEILKKEAFGK